MTELNLSLDYILGLTDITKYPHMKDINPKILANNLRKYRKKLGYIVFNNERKMKYLKEVIQSKTN